jgi:hypothetical protein
MNFMLMMNFMNMKISCNDEFHEYYSSVFLLPPPPAPRLFNMIIQLNNAVVIKCRDEFKIIEQSNRHKSVNRSRSHFMVQLTETFFYTLIFSRGKVTWR